MDNLPADTLSFPPAKPCPRDRAGGGEGRLISHRPSEPRVRSTSRAGSTRNLADSAFARVFAFVAAIDLGLAAALDSAFGFGSHEVGDACAACVPATDTSTNGRPVALGGAASAAASASEPLSIAIAMDNGDRHRPEPAPAGVRNAGGEAPVAARAARRPPSPRSAATSASCAAGAVARVAASKEEATRQICAANAQPLAAEWCRPLGHATAWRLQGRQPGPRAFQRGLQAEPCVPTPWKRRGKHDTRSDHCESAWSQRATASRWCATPCAEVARQLPLPAALLHWPEAPNYER